ncbi:protein tipE [Culicoides brevitarsis]|uniref:protein tipE n=1 Tax=Culicoides brevitarsis TaxID=469753 RepID=UPI00307C9EFF
MEVEEDTRTFKEKALFYTTAFFILLGTFSLFGFLFLVPFVIEPAFTTIFMQFDENPALCVTIDRLDLFSASNCSWASCREGCTRDIFKCTQIRVSYKLGVNITNTNINNSMPRREALLANNDFTSNYFRIPKSFSTSSNSNYRVERAIREYDDSYINLDTSRGLVFEGDNLVEYSDGTGLQGNDSEWFFIGARIFPNVKGCGYPPFLNCTIWNKKHQDIGTNFTCYYSKVDPSIVITDLNLKTNKIKLILAMAIPIPSFIISVIYLAIAYFVIYNEDSEDAPLDKNAEEIAEDDDIEIDNEEDVNTGEADDNAIVDGATTDENCCISTSLDAIDINLVNGGTLLTKNSKSLTPNSVTDINSFGHQLKVRMVDELSRDSLDTGALSNSVSNPGTLSKTMTTSISTPPGPIAAV